MHSEWEDRVRRILARDEETETRRRTRRQARETGNAVVANEIDAFVREHSVTGLKTDRQGTTLHVALPNTVPGRLTFFYEDTGERPGWVVEIEAGDKHFRPPSGAFIPGVPEQADRSWIRECLETFYEKYIAFAESQRGLGE